MNVSFRPGWTLEDIEMQITPEGVVLLAACLGNVGALIYNTAAVNTRLAAIEDTLNNGISDTVKSHGEAIAALQAVQDVD